MIMETITQETLLATARDLHANFILDNGYRPETIKVGYNQYEVMKKIKTGDFKHLGHEYKEFLKMRVKEVHKLNYIGVE